MRRLFRLEEAVRMLRVRPATIRLSEGQGKILCVRTQRRRPVLEWDRRHLRGMAPPETEAVVALDVRVSCPGVGPLREAAGSPPVAADGRADHVPRTSRPGPTHMVRGSVRGGECPKKGRISISLHLYIVHGEEDQGFARGLGGAQRGASCVRWSGIARRSGRSAAGRLASTTRMPCLRPFLQATTSIPTTCTVSRSRRGTHRRGQVPSRPWSTSPDTAARAG